MKSLRMRAAAVAGVLLLAAAGEGGTTVPLRSLAGDWFALQLRPQASGDELMRLLKQSQWARPSAERWRQSLDAALDETLDQESAAQLAEQLPRLLAGGVCLLGSGEGDERWLLRLRADPPRLCLVVGADAGRLERLKRLLPGPNYVPVRARDVLDFLLPAPARR